MQRLSVAVIPGDGIGKEVVPQGVRVLEAAADFDRELRFDFTEFPWGCDYYREHGRMMPEDACETLRSFDLIFLGAVGHPEVPDHISLWGLLIPLRREFRQYVNVRPTRLLPGITSPLRAREPGSVDFVVVRENSEGEYSKIGGRIHEGTAFEAALQVDYFSRMGVERTMRFAYELARSRRSHLTIATKSNGIVHTMPFWDEVARELAGEFPDVTADRVR